MTRQTPSRPSALPLRVLAACCAAAAAPAPCRAQCAPHWSDDFAFTTFDWHVRTLCAHDDGTGKALYAGGDFSTAGGIAVNRVAKWDGARWLPLGTGLNAPLNARVSALASFDDGSGPGLFAAGRFTQIDGQPAGNVARWNGREWSTLDGGMTFVSFPLYESVYSLIAYDDGAGPALYAGGTFTTAGGELARGLARWDGASWSEVGGGVSHPLSGDVGVRALCLHDPDGAGPKPPLLCVGGRFTQVGTLPAKSIAFWDGSTWAALGSGVGTSAGAVAQALVSFDDGTGPALYVSGLFASAGGVPANHIARWDGAAWHPLGGGLGYPTVDLSARSLAVFDDGTGPALYAGGDFKLYVGSSAQYYDRYLCKWDGAAWSVVAGATNGFVNALLPYDDGAGERLYVGGEFTYSTSGVPMPYIGVYDGKGWDHLPDGLLVHSTHTLDAFDDGSGEAVYVTGFKFFGAGPIDVNGIARWRAGAWSAVGDMVGTFPAGSTPGNNITDTAVFDEGTGPALYAVGTFVDELGTTLPHRFQRWDGVDWTPVSAGTKGLQPGYKIAVHDEGKGPALFSITPVLPYPTDMLITWTGSEWTPVTSYLGGQTDLLESIRFDGKQALYVSGDIQFAGGPATTLAYWYSGTWTAMPGFDSTVRDLEVFDDGAGEALYAVGQFSTAGGVPAVRIARFNGEAWSEVGGGLWAPPGWVYSAYRMALFDDGRGPALFIGGSFRNAGSLNGLAVNGVARWSKEGWSTLGVGIDFASISGMAVHTDRGVPSLFLTGGLSTAGGLSSGRIAQWVGCAPCPADCDRSGTLSVADFTCFQASYRSADPYADCNADATLTIADFGCFQNKYVLGCP